MNKIIILLLLEVLIPLFIYGQNVIRLTENDVFDTEPSIYKNRIVWASGKWNGAREIYLNDGGINKRLTYDNYQDYSPIVNEHYVVWHRDQEIWPNATWLHSLRCYDGTEIKMLDIGYNLDYQMRGKNIFWTKLEPDEKYHNYLFDGIKIYKDITPAVKMADLNFNTVGIPALVNDYIIYIYADSANSQTYYKMDLSSRKVTKIDSVQNGSFGAGHIENGMLIYTKLQNGKSKESYLYDGENSQKIIDAYCLELDTHFVSFVETSKQADSLTFSIWQNGKIYKVFEYPSYKFIHHPELANIETVFSGIIIKADGSIVTKIFLFKDGKITAIEGIKDEFAGNTNSAVSNRGKFAAWGSFLNTRYNVPEDFNKAEIYTICYDDSCINPYINYSTSIDAYPVYSASKIAVKIISEDQKDYVCDLYDLAGKRIVSQNINAMYGENVYYIPTYAIAQGLYIIQVMNISDPNQNLRKKLFIIN